MISIVQTLKLALSALVRNRSRSILTMLGVVIGVAAVIVTVAIGTGAKSSVASAINGLGSNLIIVTPGSVQTTGARTGNGGASTLVPADGLAVAKLPNVTAASPAVNLRTQVVGAGNNWQTTVTGVAPSYTVVRSWDVAAGRFFTQTETDDAAKVAVLGQTVVQQLFPSSDPVGQTVMIKNVPFTVIGVLTAKGQSGMGQDQDDTILIPYTSALQRITGGTTINTLMVSASDQAQIAPVTSEITSLLEQRHKIVAGQPDDFQVRNLQDIAATATSTASILGLLLAAVAAVSLVVGGIGIMNIMLVVVTERTREIGIRKAIGAPRRAILGQFLTEAVLLSLIGGLAGVVVGLVGTNFKIQGVKPIPTAGSVIGAFAVTVAVGVFFGFYPASRAAALRPVDALRYE